MYGGFPFTFKKDEHILVKFGMELTFTRDLQIGYLLFASSAVIYRN